MSYHINTVYCLVPLDDDIDIALVVGVTVVGVLVVLSVLFIVIIVISVYICQRRCKSDKVLYGYNMCVHVYMYALDRVWYITVY